MSVADPLDEQRAIKLRQRLWGAAVLIALLVIFLPLLLDGSGSESQYRRVERLRAEPPRIIGADGTVEAVSENPVANVELQNNAADGSTLESVTPPISQPVEQSPPESTSAVQPGNNVAAPKTPVVAETPQQSAEALRAWVVQAGSFSDQDNALAVRDKLRRAGFPSFVTPSDTATPLYRVRVGPMINLKQAEASRDKVMALLQRDAIVVSYP